MWFLLWQYTVGFSFGQRIKVINWALSDTITLPQEVFLSYSFLIINSHNVPCIFHLLILCKSGFYAQTMLKQNPQKDMMLRALFPFVDKQCKTQADLWVSSKAHASEGMTGERETPLLIIICSSRDGIRFLLCVALQNVILSFNCSVGENNAIHSAG